MTNDERPWVLGAHLGVLLGLGVGSFLVPLFVYLAKKGQSDIIDAHAKASLNFQLSMLLYTFIAGIAIFIVIGIPFLFILPLVNLICIILATIEADKGNLFKYPITITFVR